jgi:hypothetical protein
VRTGEPVSVAEEAAAFEASLTAAKDADRGRTAEASRRPGKKRIRTLAPARLNAQHLKDTSLFRVSLEEHRGLQTARILLHKEKVSDGYTALYLRGRLDLTVEAVIHDNEKWHPLFTEEELAICVTRLKQYGYSGVAAT